MKAIVYDVGGGSEVLRLTERPVPVPGPGEVRVEVRVSGVNPIDWKTRTGYDAGGPQVPGHDGAGVVDAVGPGVDPALQGRRVWVWRTRVHSPEGTAQEYVVVPAELAVPLPDECGFELGAALGIPALTAHRCLTVREGGPARLAAGALSGRTVLVAGGAGAVGNAAIQLARWAGARVLTTVSTAHKGELARKAGAHVVVNHRAEDAAATVRQAAPDGVDIVVEVAVSDNAPLDQAVLAPGGVVAFYSGTDGVAAPVPVLGSMMPNLRWQGVYLYGIPQAAQRHGVEAVTAAVAEGAFRVGADAGLPLHRFPLERTAEAQDAVEKGAVGKVLIDVRPR